MPSIVPLLAWDVSLHIPDGGGLRVKALVDCLTEMGLDVAAIGLGPRVGVEAHDRQRSPDSVRVVKNLVTNVKRKLLPVPLRQRVTRQIQHQMDLSPRPLETVVSTLLPSHGWAVANATKCWLDFPDLWSDFARSYRRHLNYIPVSAQAALWRRRESQESRRASLVTTASFEDARVLGNGAVWLPTPVVRQANLAVSRQSHGGSTFGFLANFNYPPNREAFDRLAKEWLPSLSRMGNVKVAGFGAGSLPVVEGIDNQGEVRSPGDFYQSIDCALSPVTLGGGMKVKVVEAIAAGLPVVVTEHSAAGLPQGLRDACLPFREVASGQSVPAFNPLHDPQLLSVMAEFTHERFREQVSRLWAERLCP